MLLRLITWWRKYPPDLLLAMFCNGERTLSLYRGLLCPPVLWFLSTLLEGNLFSLRRQRPGQKNYWACSSIYKNSIWNPIRAVRRLLRCSIMVQGSAKLLRTSTPIHRLDSTSGKSRCHSWPSTGHKEHLIGQWVLLMSHPLGLAILRHSPKTCTSVVCWNLQFISMQWVSRHTDTETLHFLSAFLNNPQSSWKGKI